MKLAILLGVSEYETQDNLPGCKNDIEVFEKIIDLSCKYEEKLVIKENTNSSEVKQKVSEFFKSNIEKGNEIEEVLYYYSGHGLYDNDEFYYIFSDFSPNKLNRTTFKNSEIDELLKSLNPKLTVKIIDACESGVKYVKEIDNHEVKRMFKETRNKFENCYFMYSSQTTESSYASKELSYFTESLVKSILEHDTDLIRYRDIMDYIADEFKEKSIEQTPYYVTQGNNTEIFTKIDDKLRSVLREFLNRFTKPTNNTEKSNSSLTLLEKIRISAKDYCTNYEEVINVFNLMEEEVEKKELLPQIKDIFLKEEEFPNEYYEKTPNINTVAEAIADREDELYIEIKKGVRIVKVPNQNRLTSLVMGDRESENVTYREEKRSYIKWYDIAEEDTPYTKIIVDLVPNYPNVNKYNCSFLFAYSKVNLIIIYSYNKYKEVKWGEYELEKVKWRKLNDIVLKDEKSIKNVIGETLDDFFEYVHKDLNRQFEMELISPLLEWAAKYSAERTSKVIEIPEV